MWKPHHITIHVFELRADLNRTHMLNYRIFPIYSYPFSQTYLYEVPKLIVVIHVHQSVFHFIHPFNDYHHIESSYILNIYCFNNVSFFSYLYFFLLIISYLLMVFSTQILIPSWFGVLSVGLGVLFFYLNVPSAMIRSIWEWFQV